MVSKLHGNTPGHLTSMKYDFGSCTSIFNLCFLFSVAGLGWRISTASVYASEQENCQLCVFHISETTTHTIFKD